MSKHLMQPRTPTGASVVIAGLALAFACASGASSQTTPLYGPKGVSPEAVRQGTLGSCYFHATIAAIASRNPDSLRAAIEGGDGAYSVRFMDGHTENVQVDDAMFARTNQFDRSDGLWVTLLFRALGQSTMRDSLLSALSVPGVPPSTQQAAATLLRSNDMVLMAYDRAVRATISQDGAMDRGALKSALSRQTRAMMIPGFLSDPVINLLDTSGFFDALSNRIQQNGELFGAYRSVGQGGLVGNVLGAFSGPGFATSLHTQDQARGLLRQMRQGGLAAVATTGQTGGPGAQGSGQDWWVPSHAYTVLDFDGDADRVTLRNPWGDHPSPGGVFTLSVADFAAAYAYLDLSKR
jgi:hypothetical protein